MHGNASVILDTGMTHLFCSELWCIWYPIDINIWLCCALQWWLCCAVVYFVLLHRYMFFSVFFRIASLVQGQFIDNILEKDLVVKKLKCIASNLCFVSLWPNDSSVSQLNYFWSNLAERYLYFLLLLSNNKKMKTPICWFKNECSPNCAFIICYVLVLYLSMLLNNNMNIPFLWFKNDSIFKTVHLFYE